MPALPCPGTEQRILGASLCIGRERTELLRTDLPPTSARGKQRGVVRHGVCVPMGLLYEARALHTQVPGLSRISAPGRAGEWTVRLGSFGGSKSPKFR